MRLFLLVQILVVLISGACIDPCIARPTSATCVRNDTWIYRLPWSVIPQHYDLFLKPNLQNYETFQGGVNITVDVVVATSCIVLNTDHLNFSSVIITGNQIGSLSSNSWVSYGALEQTVISFSQVIPIGTYQLLIEYSGLINQKNATGFFKSAGDFPSSLPRSDSEIIESAHRLHSKRSPHPRRSNNRRDNRSSNSWNSSLVMLSTQFEMMYFRSAFPGFDEPQFKATFSASVAIPANMSYVTVLFNTPVLSDTISGDERLVQFASTPHPMSCYLVAFAIGQFDFVEANSSGLTFRVYTPPGKSSMGLFALNVTIATIEYFGQIWNFPFSFPKVDSIAVPAIIEDAMENWGLLTYDPTFLLVDENTPHLQRELVCQVIVHELSHQWFGDTVTTPWWSQFFLNEGFARYLQYVGAWQLHPEYQLWTVSEIGFLQFAYGSIEQDATGLFLPALITPDEKYSGNPFESDQFLVGVQESLAYGKGASLLRTLVAHLGEEKFNALMAAHLQKRKYTNPDFEDLIEDLGNDTYARAWSDWVTRAGFPYLELSVSADWRTLYVTQKPISPLLTPSSQTWWVPLELQVQTTSSNGVSNVSLVTFDLFQNYTEISLAQFFRNGDEDISFLVANPNYTVYTVISYQDEMWDLIFANLHKQFDSPHVLQLAQQTFLLAQMAKESFALPLRLTALLSTSADSADVWNYVVSHWLSVSRSLLDAPFYSSLSQNVARAIEPLCFALGWDSANSSSLRQQALFAAVFFGSSSVTKQALERYDSVHGNVSSLPLDTLQAILYAVSTQRSNSTSQLEQIYIASVSQPEIQQAALGALMAGDDCSSAVQFVTQLHSAGNLSSSDALSAASQMLTQSLSCRATAWESITKIFAPRVWQKKGASGTDEIIAAVSGIFWQQDDVAMLDQFTTQYASYFLADQLQYVSQLTQLIQNMVYYN